MSDKIVANEQHLNALHIQELEDEKQELITMLESVDERLKALHKVCLLVMPDMGVFTSPTNRNAAISVVAMLAIDIMTDIGHALADSEQTDELPF